MDIEEKRRRNREYMREYNRRRYWENPEKVREEKRLWMAQKRAKNPEAGRAAVKKYAETHKEEISQRVKDWREKHPGYHNEWHKKNKEKNPVLYLWRSVRNRAKKEGIRFELKPEDIIVPTNCPALGIPLRIGQRGGFTSDCASVDRIIGGLGYVPGNIVIISVKANVIKRDATPDELEKVAAYARRETERVLRENGL
jgi:hypothetical protein